MAHEHGLINWNSIHLLFPHGCSDPVVPGNNLPPDARAVQNFRALPIDGSVLVQKGFDWSIRVVLAKTIGLGLRHSLAYPLRPGQKRFW